MGSSQPEAATEGHPGVTRRRPPPKEWEGKQVKMPDTIVPVVRRPVVRRVKKSDDEASKDATNTADRKLSLGVDSSKNQETAKLSLSSSPEKTSPTSTPSWKTPNSSTTSSTTPSWKTKAEPAVTPNWKTKTEPPTTPNWKTKAEPSTTPNWKTKQEPAQVEPKRKINKTPSGPAEPWMSYPVYPSLEKLDTFKHLETQTKPLKTQVSSLLLKWPVNSFLTNQLLLPLVSHNL